MPQIGNQLGYELQSYEGLFPQIIQNTIPLVWIVNTNTIQVSGDTITFDYFVANEVDYDTHDDFPDGDGNCDGATLKCPGTNKITHTLNKKYDHITQMDACRIENLANTAQNQGITVQAVKDGMVGATEQKYARGLAKKLVKNLIDGTFTSITDFVPDVNSVNVLDRIEDSVVDLENLHELERVVQTVVITYTASSELRKLNYSCCDLTTAFEPVDQNKIGVERIVKVPNLWLNDGTIQYEFTNYVRALYNYYERCTKAETIQMTNQFNGYLGYHKRATYGFFMDESVEQIPETQGVAGHKVAVA